MRRFSADRTFRAEPWRPRPFSAPAPERRAPAGDERVNDYWMAFVLRNAPIRSYRGVTRVLWDDTHCQRPSRSTHTSV